MWSREPSPSEKQENKQKATQDVSKSKNGPDQSISKSETGAISKITTEITAKPENRKTIFGSDMETATRRDGNWQQQRTCTPEPENLPSWPPTQD